MVIGCRDCGVKKPVNAFPAKKVSATGNFRRQGKFFSSPGGGNS